MACGAESSGSATRFSSSNLKNGPDELDLRLDRFVRIGGAGLIEEVVLGNGNRLYRLLGGKNKQVVITCTDTIESEPIDCAFSNRADFLSRIHLQTILLKENITCQRSPQNLLLEPSFH
jgi:hypothetical protein